MFDMQTFYARGDSYGSELKLMMNKSNVHCGKEYDSMEISSAYHVKDVKSQATTGSLHMSHDMSNKFQTIIWLGCKPLTAVP